LRAASVHVSRLHPRLAPRQAPLPDRMTRALRHFRATGYKGMLLYCRRDESGLAQVLRAHGVARIRHAVRGEALRAHLIYSSPGCARYGSASRTCRATRPTARAETTRPST
jgi:hypothetical protein